MKISLTIIKLQTNITFSDGNKYTACNEMIGLIKKYKGWIKSEDDIKKAIEFLFSLLKDKRSHLAECISLPLDTIRIEVDFCRN